MQNHLKTSGIDTLIYYPLPLHKMRLFSNRCEIPENLVESEKTAGEILSLPIEPLLTKNEMEYIVNNLREKL